MITKATIRFFRAIEKNNNREWFLENKSDYTNTVKEPVESLAHGLEKQFGKAHLFRAQRDIRFSKDKSPYKTNAGFSIEHGSASYHVQISKEGILVAGGMWDVQSDQLFAWRSLFAGEDKVVAQKIKDYLAIAEKNDFVLSTDDALKTVPRGFSKESNDIALLQLRHLAIRKTYALEDWAYTNALAEVIKKDFIIIKKWNELLLSHVGPSVIVRK